MSNQALQKSEQFSQEELPSVVIRFAGDSGDGIQVTGSRFAGESALAGNDIATLPNFPAEIRAPAGTLAGVSGFQINFGSSEVNTPGDQPDVLIAMNPAALKANLGELKAGGILIMNQDSFTEKNLSKVGYTDSPCEDDKLSQEYRRFVIPITKLTKETLKDSNLSPREVERCKNFFALGVMLWMFNRPFDSTLRWIESKFRKKPELIEANTKVLKAGLTYAEATEIFNASYVVKPAKLAPGEYRSLNGTTALTYGLIAAAQKSQLPLFFGAYPITPASELLHELSKHKRLGVTTFQAEDEIAAICSALGAAFTGSLGVTSSSGPGIALKTEVMGLALISELPLVIVNNQRGGPSTGLPTKTEQSDLFQALYGRHGESPVCVIAASSPASAFTTAFEACRIALKYMTPVILLSDGYINNSSEPWRIPDAKALPKIEVNFLKQANSDDGKFLPYLRDKETLGRPWALPGTPELMHRLGGLEKEDLSGNVSYDPENHQKMSLLRAEKIARIAKEIPPTKIDGSEDGELLLIGWGSTEGTLIQACRQLQDEGLSVSRIHLEFINPLPSDLKDIISRYKHVLIPEINLGQLLSVIRDKYQVNAKGLNKMKGQPIHIEEVVQAAKNILLPH